MKVTTVSRLPDGTPLFGGVACLQCGTPFGTDKQVSEEGFCLQCDWLMGFPESDIEMIAKGRSRGHSPGTHCKQGHEFTPENTRLRISHDRPTRVCLACVSRWNRLQYLKSRKTH